MLEGERVYAVCADQHEVVVQVRCRTRGDLERFVTTGGYSNLLISRKAWHSGKRTRTCDDGVR